MHLKGGELRLPARSPASGGSWGWGLSPGLSRGWRGPRCWSRHLLPPEGRVLGKLWWGGDGRVLLAAARRPPPHSVNRGMILY